MAETYTPEPEAEEHPDLVDDIGDTPEDNDPSMLKPGEYIRDEYGYMPKAPGEQAKEYFVKHEGNPELIKVVDKRAMSQDRAEAIRQSWGKRHEDIAEARAAIEAAPEGPKSSDKPFKAELSPEEFKAVFGHLDELWVDAIETDPVVAAAVQAAEEASDTRLNLSVNHDLPHPLVENEHLVVPDEKYVELLKSYLRYKNVGPDRLTREQTADITGTVAEWLEAVEAAAEAQAEPLPETEAPATEDIPETGAEPESELPEPKAGLARRTGRVFGRARAAIDRFYDERVFIHDMGQYKQVVDELGPPGLGRLLRPLHSAFQIYRLMFYGGPKPVSFEPARPTRESRFHRDKGFSLSDEQEMAERNRWLEQLRTGEIDEPEAPVYESHSSGPVRINATRAGEAKEEDES